MRNRRALACAQSCSSWIVAPLPLGTVSRAHVVAPAIVSRSFPPAGTTKSLGWKRTGTRTGVFAATGLPWLLPEPVVGDRVEVLERAGAVRPDLLAEEPACSDDTAPSSPSTWSFAVTCPSVRSVCSHRSATGCPTRCSGVVDLRRLEDRARAATSPRRRPLAERGRAGRRGRRRARPPARARAGPPARPPAGSPAPRATARRCPAPAPPATRSTPASRPLR